MTHRSDAIIRAITMRGYCETRVPLGADYRRWRIAPNHARRIEIYCSRKRRWLFGDLFLTEHGRLLLGVTRQIALSVPPETLANLLRDGQLHPRERPRAHAPRTLSLEELLS